VNRALRRTHRVKDYQTGTVCETAPVVGNRIEHPHRSGARRLSGESLVAQCRPGAETSAVPESVRDTRTGRSACREMSRCRRLRDRPSSRVSVEATINRVTSHARDCHRKRHSSRDTQARSGDGRPYRCGGSGRPVECPRHQPDGRCHSLPSSDARSTRLHPTCRQEGQGANRKRVERVAPVAGGCPIGSRAGKARDHGSAGNLRPVHGNRPCSGVSQHIPVRVPVSGLATGGASKRIWSWHQ